MNIIMKIASNWIRFPQCEQEIDSEKMKWQSKYIFPAAIGALDCTHIAIKKPSIHGDEYVNRKGYASVNEQATCNAEEMFTSVDVTWPGSVHDSRIWKNSNVYRIMKDSNAHPILLGDAGYGLSPFLMTPFKVPNTPAQKAFNKVLTQERVIIERCFGQLKQWFPILQNKVHMGLKKIPTLIICCCVLHNISKFLKDDSINFEDYHDFYPEGDEEEEIEDLRTLGAAKRNEISQILLRNQ